MTFSSGLKQEILANKPMRARFGRAQAYGLFLFGHRFDGEGVSLGTELEATVELFRRFARDLLGGETAFGLTQRRRGGKTVYTVSIADSEARRRLLEQFPPPGEERSLPDTPERLGAFLAGAYLACGNVSAPEKSYHLEFVVRDKALCHSLAELLERAVPGVHLSYRRGMHVAYYKECAAIEDLLTLMGATKSCLAMIDVETFKSVRNRANRATNCETANIDKLVGAATSQIADIEFILNTAGEDSLPETLRQVVRLRLAYPEASLRELAQLSETPISRSGIHHRLDKLAKIAAKLRERKGEEGNV